MIKIAIITGGDSAEATISVQSAKTVKDNLNTEKYKCTIIHLSKGTWIVNGNQFNKENIKLFDAVFMALHGPPAENGDLQPFLDDLKIPYSCCNASVSYLTFNKSLCNKKLKEFGFNCADSILYKKGEHIC